MLGVILTGIATLFGEIGDLIGKAEARKGHENSLTLGFYNNFWGGVIFLAIILFRGEFVFSLASLPTFGLRAVLEVLQAHLTAKAIIVADRTTFGFFRVFTLPLILLADVFLGYTLSLQQVIGIAVIILTLIFIFFGEKIGKAGRGLILLTAVNAVITISLFKYNITNFDSVEAEQFLISMILIGYFWVTGLYFVKQNALLLLFSNPRFLGQSLAHGFGGVLESFAYIFAPASIILAVKRSSATGWSAISGRLFFSEKHFLFKVGILILLIVGIILLAV